MFITICTVTHHRSTATPSPSRTHQLIGHDFRRSPVLSDSSSLSRRIRPIINSSPSLTHHIILLLLLLLLLSLNSLCSRSPQIPKIKRTNSILTPSSDLSQSTSDSKPESESILPEIRRDRFVTYHSWKCCVTRTSRDRELVEIE